jgi:hypothetical protein
VFVLTSFTRADYCGTPATSRRRAYAMSPVFVP